MKQALPPKQLSWGGEGGCCNSSNRLVKFLNGSVDTAA